MHASRILTRCLSCAIAAMHGARRKVLLQAVESLLQGRRLTLTDLARSWPGATWMHAPLKALDRLLSNPLMTADLPALRRAMAGWLLRGKHPLVLVDWSDLKHDGCWCLLRASVPVRGRALTLHECLYPIKQLNSPSAQRDFLKQLATLIPATMRPILVTDAGFRSDWYRAVLAQHWHYIGRLRNNTQLRFSPTDDWRPCTTLYAGATSIAKDLGLCALVKGEPMPARLVIVKRRSARNSHSGKPRRQRSSPNAKKARKGAQDPWLLVTSLDRCHSALQITRHYRCRMQIEEAFRDLKSHRYGVGFEDSLSRCDGRLTVLLMLHTLAAFASWCLGMAATQQELAHPLARQVRHRRHYSLIRLGREWLIQKDLPLRIQDILHCLEHWPSLFPMHLSRG